MTLQGLRDTYRAMNSIVFSFVIAFVLGVLLVPLARKLALVTGFVDKPDDRKQHAKPVPPIGGLVIFPVYILVSHFSGANLEYFWPLYVGLGILLVIGMLDDRNELKPWPKFFIQLGVATLVVCFGQARVFQLGDLFGFGDVGLTFFSIPFSIIAVLLLINAINLIDGLDGLAGGYSVIVLFWLIFACLMAGNLESVGGHIHAMVPLLGVLLAFLGSNIRNPWRRKASVFLGDAGSMGLGLALAWFCIDLAHQKEHVLPPISVAWILALPVIDTVAQFFRRIQEGRHPFEPDRGHFHHHFIHAGIPTGESVYFILSLAFILGAIGYLGAAMGLPQFVLMAGWMLLLVSHIVLSRKPEKYISIFNRFSR